ncbi:hypothetical protein D0Z07_3100 [Hyphodiscus hymeniophilus]|uniref:Uncharacterized protein n=1 Tax=Hyphodiscus hymeniophilus TaxID=353542 RepID=A0A9P6VM23_9HELO|nr:hypothetical protein D0Z07_3100 [Hyphodiscus hymeniophilus]
MLSLLAESWTWYAVAVSVILFRYVSRWLQLGSWKRYQLEDYIMIVVLVVMNIVAHLDTNLMLPSDIPTLTPASIDSRRHGSKLVLVVEQSMIMTIWGCKFCLLLIGQDCGCLCCHRTCTDGNFVLWGVVPTIPRVLGSAYRQWSVLSGLLEEHQTEQCSAAIHHLITNAVFNISSDLMMLSIPLPLLITSQVPRTKLLTAHKILCAVLNKYYSFAYPFSPMWTFWYIREASTAILVANMPVCWSLLRRLFHLRSFNGSSGTHSKNTTTNPRTAFRAMGRMKSKKVLGSHSSNSRPERGEMSWWDREAMRSESEEYIVMPPSKAAMPLEIWESREFDVVQNERDSSFMGNKIPQPDAMYAGPKGTKTVVTAPSRKSLSEE